MGSRVRTLHGHRPLPSQNDDDGDGGPALLRVVIGGALPVTVGASWLVAAWDQNAVMSAPTPGVARVEEVALRWVLDAVGLPPECGVGFVTGATVANFTALAAGIPDPE